MADTRPMANSCLPATQAAGLPSSSPTSIAPGPDSDCRCSGELFLAKSQSALPSVIVSQNIAINSVPVQNSTRIRGNDFPTHVTMSSIGSDC
jgi:hypothetical protein